MAYLEIVSSCIALWIKHLNTDWPKCELRILKNNVFFQQVKGLVAPLPTTWCASPIEILSDFPASIFFFVLVVYIPVFKIILFIIHELFLVLFYVNVFYLLLNTYLLWSRFFSAFCNRIRIRSWWVFPWGIVFLGWWPCGDEKQPAKLLTDAVITWLAQAHQSMMHPLWSTTQREGRPESSWTLEGFILTNNVLHHEWTMLWSHRGHTEWISSCTKAYI